MAKKKKKTSSLFPSFSPTTLVENSTQTIKDVSKSITTSIDLANSGSGRFTNFARKVSIGNDGNEYITGTTTQTRYNLISTGNTTGIAGIWVPEGQRFIITSMDLSIKDDDNSMIGMKFTLRDGTTAQKTYYYLDGIKFKHFDFSNPAILFENQLQVYVDTTSIFSLTPTFSGDDCFSITLHGWIEYI